GRLHAHSALPARRGVADYHFGRRYMRTLLCAALVVAACAPGDKASTATAGGPGQKFVGVFEGRSYRQVADTGIPWRSVMTIAPDGSLRGTLTFTSITAGTGPDQVRDAGGHKPDH